MKELYAICENIVLSKMYDIYCIDSVFCSCDFYDVENQWNRPINCTNEDGDDQVPERIVVCGASIKGSYSSSPTDIHIDIHKELLAPSEKSMTKLLCHITDKKDLIPLHLEHDR